MKQLLKLTAVVAAVTQLAGMKAALGQAATPPAAAGTNQPHIQFADTSFNFGKVTPTDKPVHDFIFTNTGLATLEITGVRPGCGCTTAGNWDHQVEPGKTGKIPLQFNPANFSGPVTKGATVTCNDPTQGSIYLQFQANIWRPLEVQPQYVYFMPIEDEITNDTKVVRIINHQEEAVTLQPPQSSSAAFTTELKTIQPGKEYELRVSYAGPVSNATTHGTITINTSMASLPTLSVTVYAMPQPALIASPARIQLPAGPLPPGYRYTEIVRSRSSIPLKLSDPVVNADGVSVQMEETEPGKAYKLSLAFPVDFKVQAASPVELTVKTSLPKHPVLNVPIAQLAPSAPAAVAPLPVNKSLPSVPAASAFPTPRVSKTAVPAIPIPSLDAK